MRVEVKVMQEHINAGKFLDCESCPVALALKEATGDTWLASQEGLVNLDGEEDIPPPSSVLRFMANFDAGEPVSPFTFPIDLPADEHSESRK